MCKVKKGGIIYLVTALVFLLSQSSIVLAADAPKKDDKAADIAKKLEQEKMLKEQEQKILANQHVETGKKLFQDKNYDKAKSEFETALSIDPGLEKAKTYLSKIDETQKAQQKEALSQKVDAGISEYKSGNYDKSIAVFDEVLAADPENSKASAYKAKAVDAKKKMEAAPKGKSGKDEGSLYKEGVTLYNAGNYDAAMSVFQEVVEINPVNVPARRYINEILERKRELQARDNKIIDENRIFEVTKAWEPPAKKDASQAVSKKKDSDVKVKTPQQIIMEEKAQQIIPEINFTDAHLRDVIKYLSKISGVNIILDEDLFKSQAAAPASPEAGMEAAPAAEPGAVEPGMEGQPAAPQGTPMLSDKITISLTNIPLIEALKYILTAKGLKYRIDEYAILVSTQERLQDIEMDTRYYHLASGTGQFTIFEMSREKQEVGGPIEQTKTLGGKLEATKMVTIKDVLENSGVPWPEGSKVFLDSRTGTLIVRNTPANLSIIEDILRTLDVTPFQISIEAKFVEISNDKTKELGFDVSMGEIALKNKATNADRGRTSMFKRNGSPIVDGQNKTGTQSIAASDLTSGTRSIMDMRDSLSAVMVGNQQKYRSTYRGDVGSMTASTISSASALADAPLTLTGILTDPEFQIVMRAIDQSGYSNMLSSPKITTVNNQAAQIKVVTEIIYPADFEVTPPTIQAGGSEGSDMVTPGIAVPSEFVTRDTGIILDVTPSAGADRKTIHLTVVPEVSELVGWIDYGIPGIPASASSGGYPPIPVLQPIFDSQKVSTSVVINDGDAVVLGGLMKDDTRTIKDKTPIFGDIPVIGRLFRTEGESKIKTNLMIFIKANLLTPSGDELRNQQMAS